MDPDHNVTPGWYILTPGGWAGPYRDRQCAIDCRIPGVSWPVTYRGGKPGDGGDDDLRAEADAQHAEDLREYEREQFVDVRTALIDDKVRQREQDWKDARWDGRGIRWDQ